ncbi:hypothetical protein H0H92_006185 [Tricholoma furcatifolium]|nr:hypothetical protein H0H92_006185 [Tricholoma furcatifolium]
MSDSSGTSESPPAEPKRAPSPPPANEKRVSLACLRCRTKRARCSGDKPVCRACEKAKEECIWPTGRRRKRTRKEMEEEERRERLASAAADSLGHRDKRTPSRAAGWVEQLSAESYAEPMAWEFQAPAWLPSMSAHTSLPAVTTSPSSAVHPTPFANPLERDYPRPRPMTYHEGDAVSLPHDDPYYYRYQPVNAAPAPPGSNRLSLKLPGTSFPGTAPMPRLNSQPSPPSPVHDLEDMFDEIGLPYPHLYNPLLDTFFQTLSRHFPSISRQRIEERLASGTMSAFFLNCTFLPSARDDPSKACAPYIAKAQELIIVLIHLPTTDVVTGLLLLSWATYGQNSESGLWDRILSFSTGRPPTIPEEIIEIPLPIDEDFVPDPARADLEAAEEIPQPTSFVHMVRLMVLTGRISTVLAGCRGETRTLLPRMGQEYPVKLKALQGELVQLYAELPEEMKWSVDAFKHQEARGHGDSFLTLHLWANSVLAVIFYPELQEKPEGSLSPVTQPIERSTKLALSSSRTIAECLVFADLFASHSYLTSPFVVQPIYVASIAFINDMKATSGGLDSSPENKPNQIVDNLLSTLARQNLAVLTKAIQRMEHYWVGISSVSDILETHAAGLGFQRIDPSRKPRLALPDLPLPDSTNSAIFTTPIYPQRTTSLPTSMILDTGDTSSSPPNMKRSLSGKYNPRSFYTHPSDVFNLDGIQMVADTISDANNSHLPPGLEAGRI